MSVSYIFKPAVIIAVRSQNPQLRPCPIYMRLLCYSDGQDIAPGHRAVCRIHSNGRIEKRSLTADMHLDDIAEACPGQVIPIEIIPVEILFIPY